MKRSSTPQTFLQNLRAREVTVSPVETEFSLVEAQLLLLLLL